jgi:glyoxylase-like metal-dependent hydrolase (beta-lactamase superfamily II)
MGLSSVADELADLIDKPVIAVATHGHDDHIGGGPVRATRSATLPRARRRPDPRPSVTSKTLRLGRPALTGRTERFGYWMLRVQIPPTG